MVEGDARDEVLMKGLVPRRHYSISGDRGSSACEKDKTGAVTTNFGR